MKKSYYYLAIAATAMTLVCGGCGRQAGSGDENKNDSSYDTEDVSDDSDADASKQGQNDAASSGTASETDESKEDAAEESSDDEAQDSGIAGEAGSVASRAGITITLQTEELDRITAEDGTLLCTNTATYPVVSIVGNEAAAKIINADIRTRVDNSRFGDAIDSESSLVQMANEDYQFALSEGYSFMPYEFVLTFSVGRADSNVISFTELNYSYFGGAHGNYDLTGINFDTRTGKLIAFSDLGENETSFYADTLAYNKKLAKTKEYQAKLYDDEFSSVDEELESVLYSENSWYLSPCGLIFISNPYSLGPYASGAIEFLIPYAQLQEMGLRSPWQYPDRAFVKMVLGSDYTVDINGDGKEDNLRYDSEDFYAEDGTYEYQYHANLLINGTDFAKKGDSTCQWLLSNQSTLLLHDLDPADGSIEIVFMTNIGPDNEYLEIPDSYFYRYGADGSLTCLGKTQGDVTDPTVEVDISSQ